MTVILVLTMCATTFAADTSLSGTKKQFDVTNQTVSANEDNTMVIKSDGSLWSWGSNIYGQLGDDSPVISNHPTPVQVMTGVISISVGGGHNEAIQGDGTLWAWGGNEHGQLGNDGKANAQSYWHGPCQTIPIKIMDDVISVSAGCNHTVAIKSDGSLWAWGDGKDGQLGDGTAAIKYTPVKVMDDVISVSAGSDHTMAILSDNSLWAWGNNECGQIGDGTTTNKLEPVKIMDDVIAVSASGGHTVAIKSDNSLWAWGYNGTGAFLDSLSAFNVSPKKVMEDVISVSIGSRHTMAVKSDGSLWAWGINDGGQLGDGTNEFKAIPVKILDDVASVAAGLRHTMAIKKDGSLWAWGSNGDGEENYSSSGVLGDGTFVNKNAPEEIMESVMIPSKTALELVAFKSIKTMETKRLSGNNRFQTAVAISKSGWSHSDNVLIADGNNFPDALVGSSFAYLKDAPILITPSDSLDNDTRAEIERLGTKTVYILGNTTSISSAIENDLKQKYNVIRIGGPEVLDTAVKVGEEVRKLKQFDTVAIATQANFPDALAIAPFSARDTMPILFTEQYKLRDDTKQALQAWGVKNVVIAGGTGVISNAVRDELYSMGILVYREAGEDRYDTALEIIKHFEPAGGYTNVSIATGENYPDALTGAVLAAKNNTPLVLVQKDSVKSSISDYISKFTLGKAYIFGGTAVVSTKLTGN